MERTVERSDDLIDLGAVSVETKGAIGGQNDTVGLLPKMGLSDD